MQITQSKGWADRLSHLPMHRRLQALCDIGRLRRAGLAVAWNTQLHHEGLGRIRFGEGCAIGVGSLVAVGRLVMGDQVRLGDYANVRSGASEITFGSRVLCSQFVSFVALNHKIGPDGVPMWHEVDRERAGIVVGDDCWFGTHSIVLPGVRMGDRCVVGAGSVVTRSFPTGSRIAGSPARLI